MYRYVYVGVRWEKGTVSVSEQKGRYPGQRPDRFLGFRRLNEKCLEEQPFHFLRLPFRSRVIFLTYEGMRHGSLNREYNQQDVFYAAFIVVNVD